MYVYAMGAACLCDEDINGINDQRKNTSEFCGDYRSLQICMCLNRP